MFKAANERAWAATLTVLGVQWKYEALEPELSRALRYQPDFWLCDVRAWIEIKSSRPTPGEMRVARELLAADGHPVYILSGWPGKGRFDVCVFRDAGEAAASHSYTVGMGIVDWPAMALCELFDCNFLTLYKAFDEVKARYRREAKTPQ